MLAVTVFGLIFTPVFYVTIQRLREGGATRANPKQAASVQPAE
jgi:hypothetical protein